MKDSLKAKSGTEDKTKETGKEAREKQRAKEKAEKKVKEETKRRIQAEEKAWKEAERLSKKQAEKELKEERERLKRREQLVNKLGTQKPGKYIINVESQNTESIGTIESRLRKTQGLEIVYSGGSTEGVQFGIRLDQETAILLNITDLPQVAKAELKHTVIRVKLK